MTTSMASPPRWRRRYQDVIIPDPPLACPPCITRAGAHMNRLRFATFLTLLLASSVARAGNWPQWRGPDGQGYSEDTKVPLKWGDKENLLWKTKLPGHGNSSPVVWGDRLFVTAASPNGKERYVLCVRITDGKVLWQDTAA